jgi:branched-subunit amino acid aminotransferase/4-amino-4-deoxychorismate lyase
MVHEGPMPWSGAKVSNHLLFALAGEHARATDCDEALLFDRDGYLVEGSRSNLVVVGEAGAISTPDLARGGVAGIGLEVLREQTAEIGVREIAQTEITRAREIIAVNAIRGPKPIVSLDGHPVGDGSPGPVARRLGDLFDSP